MVRARFRRWRLKNLEYCAERHRQWVRENPVRSLFFSVKARAKRDCQPFELTIDDLQIPEFCPVLGIPMSFAGIKNRFNSPSVDRFDNTKGYLKGNIRIISYRANHLKADGTIEELEKVLAYMRGGN